MMKRSFLPVGQGAFYVETFFDTNNEYGRKINIVYDCGAASDLYFVEERIKEQFLENEIIDAVFISHFDDDHINGLPFLLKYCHVKNMFFPFITTEEIILHQLSSLISKGENSVVYGFLRNPYSYLEQLGLEEIPRLFQVYPSEEENKGSSNDFIGFDARKINSGSNVTSQIFDTINDKNKPLNNWEFVPFIFRCSSKEKQFELALKSELHINSIPHGESLVELYKNHKDAVKKAFAAVPGSNNTNSMVLFSGARDKNYKQGICSLCWHRIQYPKGCRCDFNFMRCKKPCGCLYTGDYDASGAQKWNNLKSAYDLYWNYIGCIQIPHHGSKHNYNSEFSKMNAYTIISAGSSNKYRHPHSSVVKNLIVNRSELYLVTESLQSRVDFLCNY